MNKDPSLWAEIVAAVKAALPQLSGVGIAILLAYGRMIYDSDNRQQRDHWIEPLLCGLITWAATSGLELLLELFLPGSAVKPLSLSPLLGGVIGLIGVKKLRAIAIKKVGGTDDQ